jgi:hypothetical protein
LKLLIQLLESVRASRNQLRAHLGKASRDNHGMNKTNTEDSLENKSAFSQKVYYSQDTAIGTQM